MATKVSTPADHDSELVAELRLLRGQVDEMRRERDRDRTEIAMLRAAVRTATGRDAEPVVHRQVRSNPLAWEDSYPEHDQAYVDAFTRYGSASPQARAALRAARERVAERKAAMPGRPADFEAADKNRNASIDLAGVPVEPGGTFNRDPQTGQLHISHRAEATCSAGHRAEEGKPFCPVCGGPVGSPALGKSWAARPGTDDDLDRDHVLDQLREERLRAEGILDD